MIYRKRRKKFLIVFIIAFISILVISISCQVETDNDPSVKKNPYVITNSYQKKSSF